MNVRAWSGPEEDPTVDGSAAPGGEEELFLTGVVVLGPAPDLALGQDDRVIEPVVVDGELGDWFRG